VGPPEQTDRWFSVRCVLRAGGTYEERINLWRVGSFAEAIAAAEVEAEAYAADVGAVYAGLAQAYELFDAPGHGAEVFSLMRDSDLDAEAYLEAFFATGREREGTVDQDGPWVVWRQDDNGNRFEVTRCPTRSEAERIAAEFEARGHRQTYWAAKSA
jgi:hypothetical protein